MSAIGLFGSAPLLFLALVVAEYNANLTWVLVFLAETLLCLDWAIVTDILLYVTVPTRRSTAEAVQILTRYESAGISGNKWNNLSDTERLAKQPLNQVCQVSFNLARVPRPASDVSPILSPNILFISHLLGDAGSSYLIGQLSDVMKDSISGEKRHKEFYSLQRCVMMSPDFRPTHFTFIRTLCFPLDFLYRSLFINPFVGIIGGMLFLVCAW